LIGRRVGVGVGGAGERPGGWASACGVWCELGEDKVVGKPGELEDGGE
jgi:hypothetical protein